MTFKEAKPFSPEEIVAHKRIIIIEVGYDISDKRLLQIYSGMHLDEIIKEIPELEDEAKKLGEKLNVKLREFVDKFVTAFLEKIDKETDEDTE